MNNSGYAAIALLACAGLTTSSSQAAERSLQQEARLLDSNADGIFSLDEYEAGVESRFKAMDKDGDGFVTADELDAVRLEAGDLEKTPSADRIAAMDVDKDGKMSETEHRNSARERFDEADASGDGSLDSEEMKTAAGSGHG